MAEYQNTTVSSGEMTQRFIEFVMMQAQNAAFMLGQIPHPQSGKSEVNLEVAQLLIDQLAMIQEKTKGNLNSDESRILAGAISNLQMAFVEAVREEPSSKAAPQAEAPPLVEQEPRVEQTPREESRSEPTDADGKKKFVKSYGS
ncbi:MAG: hypothetical protein QOE88_2040 [Verrucomicrobiota bacterium]|jgi:Domain of unknown function (DUF1844)|nr:hypothetical protein [Verrucomicrobiota bacterium]MEA3164222.1 hypothetical protein [Verrucomicrobiota bacterium]